MIKNLISPIQAWLLSQGRCVGCGRPLVKGSEKEIRDQIATTCSCGRIFIRSQKNGRTIYRRALFSEV